MLIENERFLTKIELLPQTICHGDTYPTNFMSRPLPDGRQQTVALDWALAGIAPLGDDLGQFVFGAQTNLKEANRMEVDQVLFESYLAGLRESGCRVDPQQVRFGYTASAALRVGLFQLFLIGEELRQSAAVTDLAVEHLPVPDCFEVTMANEAYELLKAIE
jgi:thiamine kinase-like enzyme